MSEIENMNNAINEATAIRKKAVLAKSERVEKGEKEGEPTKEDYENADKSLTQELADFIKEGSQEFQEISADIENKFKERMEQKVNSERLPKRLLILECTSLDDLLGRLVVLSDERLNNTNVDMIDVTTKADELSINFNEISGVIITGSPADIVEKEQKSWIGKMEEFIEGALENNIPVLGICFGIQAYADIKGREVPKNEGGREMGVWETDMFLNSEEAEHPIFKGIDFKEEKNGENILKNASLKTLGSHAYHVEYNPKVQSENMHGFRFTEEGYYYPMVEIEGQFIGLQFHPEFSTPEGIEILKSLVKKRSDKLVVDGRDPVKILEGLEEYKSELMLGSKIPDNVKFLQNFVSMVFDQDKK